mgnify:CR=1 FL=1
MIIGASFPRFHPISPPRDCGTRRLFINFNSKWYALDELREAFSRDFSSLLSL